MIRNLVVVSDLHCGCRLGLCPPKGVVLDDGEGQYLPNDIQKAMWKYWQEFWGKWVPLVTRGEDYAVVINGDLVDGVHHGAVSQISHNLVDQVRIAVDCLRPIRENSKCKDFYVLRGTPVHGGQSGQQEEQIGEALRATRIKRMYSAYELSLRVGQGLVHLTHHIGTSGAMAYESSALMSELTTAYNEAGRWRKEPADILCRCLSDDTELLTRRGWKGKDDVTESDVVLTFHPLTEELQWQPVLEKVVNEVEPAMIHMTGKGMDCMVTPDHNLLVRSQHGDRGVAGGAWYFKKAIDVMASLGKGHRTGTHLEVPVAGWYRGTPVSLTDAELWLLGFFMADGSYVKNAKGRAYAMRVHQMDERAAEVEDRLRAAGIQDFTRTVNCLAGEAHYDHRHRRFVHTRKDCSTWYIRNHHALRLMAFLDSEKCLTEDTLEMTAQQFSHLLEGFKYGNGSKTHTRLFNACERMLDQLQELLVKHGYKSSLHYGMHYTTKRNVKKRAGTLNYTPNKRTVHIGQKKAGHEIQVLLANGGSWCVRVQNQTLVTRRKGAVLIVGNSHRHRCLTLKVPSARTAGIVVTTPGWQAKTPFAYRIAGARLADPQFGGILVRYGDEDGLYVRERVWCVDDRG